MEDTKIPRDEYSSRLRELQANPTAIEKTSVVELIDLLGHVVTWHVRTIRVDGGETVAFLQRQSADGGVRFVLPEKVVAALERQGAGAVSIVRKRAARTAAATRATRGIKSTFGRK